MVYNEKSFAAAMAEISKRRADARFRYERRFAEVGERYPEISEQLRAISETSLNLSRLVLQKPDNAEKIIQDVKNNSLSNWANIKKHLAERGLPEDYLELRFYCEKCEDSGYCEGRICECVKRLICEIDCEEILKNSSLALCKFSDFKLDYYSNSVMRVENGEVVPRENMAEILNYCENYAASFGDDSPSLLFIGKTGLGKTHLSLAIANEVIKKGYSVLYITANELVNKTQNEYFGKEKSNETLDAIFSANLVILDDLGAEFDTKFSLAVIYDLVNTRQNRNLPTIINTNLSASELVGEYNERIASRIVCCYKMFRFFGKDIRQIKSRSERSH
ncbi:MAG: ATP-binding protein [Oscillospiraceae bacterium]|nr:ATP-binding protein [Oscillospiraceae bacterium]